MTDVKRNTGRHQEAAQAAHGTSRLAAIGALSSSESPRADSSDVLGTSDTVWSWTGPSRQRQEWSNYFDRIPERWRTTAPALDASTVPLMARLNTLVYEVHRFNAVTLRPHKLLFSEFTVLNVLLLEGEPHTLSPVELGHVLRQTSAGVTKTVGRLVERGLVRRRPDETDKRRLDVQLTETGVHLALEVTHERFEAQTRLFGPLLDEASTDTVIGVLDTLLDVLAAVQR